MRKRITLIALVLISLFITPANAAGNARHITVTGTGTAMIAPDAVRFFAAISVVGATNKVALASTNKSANSVRDALKTSGIAASDIKTSSLTVYPEYNYSQDKGQELIGYRASQSFTVVVRKADNAGSVIDAVVEAGGAPLQITGVAPFLSKGSSATAAARKAAVLDAKERARTYANLLGQSLGKVMYLNEVSAPVYNFPMLGAEKMASDATQIDLGETEVTVTVNVRWALN